MTTQHIAHPPIATHEEWLDARKKLLVREKELTRLKDKLNADRRRLPMVKLEKTYEFDTPEGRRTLGDLFDGKIQLIVYHFMFAPDWDAGCPGCTGYVDELGNLSLLEKRNTSFTLVSRAPLDKLQKYKAERGWNVRWASSYGSDFNYDFHVTHDDSVVPAEYNFKTREEIGDAMSLTGEAPGISVFFRLGDEVYHTYSAYARGVESLTDGYDLLDITPYGRQEDWEDSPEGWPQQPTYG